MSPKPCPTDPEVEMALRSLPGWFWHPGHLAQYRCIRAVDILQTQLREAQEERDRLGDAYIAKDTALVQALAEKDAAIKRGAEAIHVFHWMHRGRERWRERAEAAERDAEAKGAALEDAYEHVALMSGWRLEDYRRAMSAITPAEKEAPE